MSRHIGRTGDLACIPRRRGVSIFAWGELGEQCADLLAERGDGLGRLSATAPLVS